MWKALDVEIDLTMEGSAVVRLIGELDLATSSEFDDTMRSLQLDGRPHVILDLSGLAFMDSTGLRAIVNAQRRTRVGGRTLVLRSGARQVQRVIDLAGVAHIFVFEETAT